jgi:hypothetical protein
VWWIPYKRLPLPGKSVAIIAILAALMSVHADLRPRHKFIYFALMSALLMTEFRAIRKDREINEATQKEWNTKEDDRVVLMLTGERENTKNLLDQENQNLGAILKQDQNEFVSTITALLRAHREDEKQFSGVLAKQQELFDHEEQLAESLNGSLLPSNEPTPAIACRGSVPSDGVVLLLGDESRHNGAVVTAFPHVVLALERKDKTITPMVSLNRDPKGMLTVLLDIRSQDGRIIARMNEDGFVVNRNNYLEMKKDKSSLEIIDEYGNEVLKVHYINPHAISVGGLNIGLPPLYSNICSSGSTYDFVISQQ